MMNSLEAVWHLSHLKDQIEQLRKQQCDHSARIGTVEKDALYCLGELPKLKGGSSAADHGIEREARANIMLAERIERLARRIDGLNVCVLGHDAAITRLDDAIGKDKTSPAQEDNTVYREGWEALADGGIKHDDGKPRFDLLDSEALEEVAKVLTFGAKKYGADNWRKGINFSRLIAAALRHISSIKRGEDKDPETGLHHAAHAICCLMFLIWSNKHRKDRDDRFFKYD